MNANQRTQIASAQMEASAVHGWLLVATGYLRDLAQRSDGKQHLSAEGFQDAVAEARAAMNRFEDVCR